MKTEELISIYKEIKNIYVIITQQYSEKKQTSQEHLRKKSTSLVIHQEHIDNKRTVIIRRFQTINRLSK